MNTKLEYQKNVSAIRWKPRKVGYLCILSTLVFSNFHMIKIMLYRKINTEKTWEVVEGRPDLLPTYFNHMKDIDHSYIF